MTPPLTGPELAHAFEQAEALHLQRQVDTYGRITGRAARTLSVCGGVAAFTDPAFGRKLNHVTGFAMGVAVDAAALAALEAGYAALGLGTEVDLCPHAHASAAPALGARGYVLDAFSNFSIVGSLARPGIVGRKQFRVGRLNHADQGDSNRHWKEHFSQRLGSAANRQQQATHAEDTRAADDRSSGTSHEGADNEEADEHQSLELCRPSVQGIIQEQKGGQAKAQGIEVITILAHEGKSGRHPQIAAGGKIA